jgi:RimJ/RimL family protein N-acetyltransferase
VNPAWRIQTGRLVLTPVGWQDLPDLRALKGDPGVYGQMLGGVRSPGQVAAELAEDVSFWAARGVGMWLVRDTSSAAALGTTGLHERLDGRGAALRVAFRPEVRGHGLAREAAAAALQFAHHRAGLERVVAVARDTNIASRALLGAIGMRPCGTFERDGSRMLVFESVATPRPDAAWR